MSKMTMRRRGSMRAGVLTAIGMLVALALAVYWALSPKAPKPPPHSAWATLDPVVVEADPYKVITPPPSSGGDGAADVQRAIQTYLAAAKQIVDARRSGRMDAGAKSLDDIVDDMYREDVTASTAAPVSVAADLLASAEKGGFNFDRTISIGRVEWRPPGSVLDALSSIPKAAIIEAKVAAAKGDAVGAQGILRATLIYGIRLANTHSRVWFQMTGFETQAFSAWALAGLWQKTNSAKAALARSYYIAANKAFLAANDKFGNLCRKLNHWNVGDLIYIATEHPDPAWRVEALVTMGMARHRTPQYKEILEKTLDAFLSDPNPVVASAARWARELPIETYRIQATDTSD